MDYSAAPHAIFSHPDYVLLYFEIFGKLTFFYHMWYGNYYVSKRLYTYK
jgi:hypothetical protein